MNRVHLRFHTYELQEYHTVFLYEWLLLLGNRLGIRTGTAIRATAGCGRFDTAHPPRAHQLSVDRPVLVEFIVSEEDAEKLLTLMAAEDIRVFYTRHAVECGEVGMRDKLAS